MSEPQRVELSILGQTLALRSAASPEHLRALAAYVEDRVATLRRSGVADPGRALILAALDITDELFRAREEEGHRVEDIEARLTKLVALLDKVTPPASA
jgi:cell division protein ZapA (FtsZ GTPase activity inhibitor)